MMAVVLVPGGQGVLGRHVVAALEAAGHEARALSRSTTPRLDVLGDVEGAVTDVEAVIYCATSAFRHAKKTEAEGIANLAGALPAARFVYPSIVGIDDIDFSYYKAKRAGEAAIQASGVDHVIRRLTQFHEFADRLAAPAVAVVPKHFRTQTIAASEAARFLVQDLESRTTGRAPDTGGPEVHAMIDLVRQRRRHDGRRGPAFEVPMGAFSRGLQQGHQLCLDNAAGRLTWQEHLAAT